MNRFVVLVPGPERTVAVGPFTIAEAHDYIDTMVEAGPIPRHGFSIARLAARQ